MKIIKPETEFSGFKTRHLSCFVWKRRFQALPRVALLGNAVSKHFLALLCLEMPFPSISRVALFGNAVSKHFLALLCLETPFPSISSRCFAWKRRFQAFRVKPPSPQGSRSLAAS